MREDTTGSPASPDDLADAADLDEVIGLLADDLRAVIERTCGAGDEQPAREFAAQVLDTDEAVAAEDPDATGFGASVAFLVLARWITVLRDGAPDPAWRERALGWVGRALNAGCESAARVVAGIELAEAQEVDKAADELGTDFLPALVWLTSGLVAEYADGDAGSLPPP